MCLLLEVKDIISYNMYISSECFVMVTGLLGCDTVLTVSEYEYSGGKCCLCD